MHLFEAAEEFHQSIFIISSPLAPLLQVTIHCVLRLTCCTVNQTVKKKGRVGLLFVSGSFPRIPYKSKIEEMAQGKLEKWQRKKKQQKKKKQPCFSTEMNYWRILLSQSGNESFLNSVSVSHRSCHLTAMVFFSYITLVLENVTAISNFHLLSDINLHFWEIPKSINFIKTRIGIAVMK